MLYLLFRIMVFLIAAAVLGFGVGWYVRQASSAKRETEIQKQLNAARSRVPQLEVSVKSRDVDCERLRQELEDVEKKFVLAGDAIEKRDIEVVERDRKIVSLNNRLEILKSTSNQDADSYIDEYSEQGSISRKALDEKDKALGEHKKLLAQLEVRLDVQDKLISETEIREETEAVEIASMQARYDSEISTLEEMLAEEQSKVASYVGAQNETEEHIRELTEDVSELRSVEGQREAEMTRLEKGLAKDRQSRQVLEQELENARESGRKADTLETALAKLQSESESRSALARRELADIQSRLEKQKNELSLLEKRNAGLEDQLTRSRQAQLKLAVGYNEGNEARKQLQALQEQSEGHVADESNISQLEERIDLQIQQQRSLEAQVSDGSEQVRKLEAERALQQKSLEILSQQLDDARESEVRHVQRHRELEQIVEKLKHTPLPAEPAVLYEKLPARVDNKK